MMTYPEDLTLRAARDRYFETNGFGANGGYDDEWVDFKLGPIPFPFPNSPARVKAVRYHDLHHVLTGYRTDFRGELEISAWEIAAGCKSMAAAWVLNLSGMGGGLLRCPKRSLAAFVRGRRHRTLYGEDYEALLDLTVAEARAKYAPTDVDVRPRASDIALFVLSTFAGFLLGWLTLWMMLPLVPVGLLMNHLRKRATA
jgi:hypothetical protein